MSTTETRWPLLKSHAVFLADAQRLVQQAQTEYQARVQLAFLELAQAREVDPETKMGTLTAHDGQCYFVVSDAPSQDHRRDAVPERSGARPLPQDSTPESP